MPDCCHQNRRSYALPHNDHRNQVHKFNDLPPVNRILDAKLEIPGPVNIADISASILTRAPSGSIKPWLQGNRIQYIKHHITRTANTSDTIIFIYYNREACRLGEPGRENTTAYKNIPVPVSKGEFTGSRGLTIYGYKCF